MSTDPTPDASIAVLGGGPAGLAAGLYARRRGLDVRLYEASSQVGGNTRTLQLGPFRYDTGAHRFHDKNARVTADVKALLGDDLRRVDAPSQICWRSRRIDFPLAPYDLLQKLPLPLLARIVWEQVSVVWLSTVSTKNFEEMAHTSYRPTLARLFLLNYTEKLWGTPPGQLSPQVAGGRLEGLDLKTFLLEAFGGPRTKARHLDGSFYYPRYGYGMIADATADALGRDRIQTGARITRLEHDGERLSRVLVNEEEEIHAEAVISTLPLTLVLCLLDPPPPEDVQAAATSIRFRHLRLAVLGIDTPQLTPNASLYFPERSVPFTRLYEPKNRSPDMAPPDQTAVVLELPCDRDDGNWQAHSDTLKQWAVEMLSAYGLAETDEVVAFETHAVPFAYPVLEVGTEAKADRLKQYLSRFDNLHLLGRSARFSYTHVHDLFGQARQLADRLVAG